MRQSRSDEDLNRDSASTRLLTDGQTSEFQLGRVMDAIPGLCGALYRMAMSNSVAEDGLSIQGGL